MKSTSKKHLWFYPILFGLLGAFLGLIIRFLFAYTDFVFPIKNIIHSHSHIMLLGFLFNALVVLIWERFIEGIDNTSYKLYLALQVCLGGMLVAFIIQGYAFYSILFSTLHLWLSYVFVIRLWKRLKGNAEILKLMKLGIVFHFISSIGPYCLGPLMVFEMSNSPWYQQAVFFYLHFQFFGVLFLLFLAVFLKQINANLKRVHFYVICFSIIGLFAHSLDYSFNHWLINIIGGLSSILLTAYFLTFLKPIRSQSVSNQIIFIILIVIGICNVLGSFPLFADLVINNHFILIAWLHLLFLGLYVPFIWMNSPMRINSPLWIFYFITILSSELILVFPDQAFSLFNISIMQLLFFSNIAVLICFINIHFRYLISNYKK